MDIETPLYASAEYKLIDEVLGLRAWYASISLPRTQAMLVTNGDSPATASDRLVEGLREYNVYNPVTVLFNKDGEEVIRRYGLGLRKTD